MRIRQIWLILINILTNNDFLVFLTNKFTDYFLLTVLLKYRFNDLVTDYIEF